MITYVNQELYPTEFALHKKYAGSELALDLIWTHCNVVTDIAMDLYDSGRFDTSKMPRGLAIKAGLLFDIGVYACEGFEWIPGQPLSNTPYVQHTVIGGQILADEGYSTEIVRVAQIHTGVGLTSQDITEHMLQLPVGEYVPATDLEWLITYSSKFHSKAPKFKTVEDIENSLAKYGQEKLNIFQQLKTTFGIPHLDQIREKHLEWHQNFAFRMEQITQGSIQNSIITLPTVDLNSAGIAVSTQSEPKAPTISIDPLQPVGPPTPAQPAMTLPEPIPTSIPQGYQPPQAAPTTTNQAPVEPSPMTLPETETVPN